MSIEASGRRYPLRRESGNCLFERATERPKAFGLLGDIAHSHTVPVGRICNCGHPLGDILDGMRLLDECQIDLRSRRPPRSPNRGCLDDVTGRVDVGSVFGDVIDHHMHFSTDSLVPA
jgi:hypothetical protein